MSDKLTALDKLTEKLNLAVDNTVTNVINPSYDAVTDEAEEIKKLLGTAQQEETFSEAFSRGASNVVDEFTTNTKSFIDQVKTAWNANYTENLELAASNKESRSTYKFIASINDNGIANTLSNVEVTANALVNTVADSVGSIMEQIVENGAEVMSKVPLVGDAMTGMMGGITSAVGGIIQSFASAISSGYNDGATETVFGLQELTSWIKLTKAIKNGTTNKKIKIITTTPLDAGTNSSQLYCIILLF